MLLLCCSSAAEGNPSCRLPHLLPPAPSAARLLLEAALPAACPLTPCQVSGPVEALLDVASHPDDSICSISFNFWHRLSRALTIGLHPEPLGGWCGAGQGGCEKRPAGSAGGALCGWGGWRSWGRALAGALVGVLGAGWGAGWGAGRWPAAAAAVHLQYVMQGSLLMPHSTDSLSACCMGCFPAAQSLRRGPCRMRSGSGACASSHPGSSGSWP